MAFRAILGVKSLYHAQNNIMDIDDLYAGMHFEYVCIRFKYVGMNFAEVSYRVIS